MCVVLSWMSESTGIGSWNCGRKVMRYLYCGEYQSFISILSFCCFFTFCTCNIFHLLSPLWFWTFCIWAHQFIDLNSGLFLPVRLIQLSESESESGGRFLVHISIEIMLQYTWKYPKVNAAVTCGRKGSSPVSRFETPIFSPLAFTVFFLFETRPVWRHNAVNNSESSALSDTIVTVAIYLEGPIGPALI